MTDRPLREVIAEIVAPHIRGMTSISPDNETVHRNREYALSVADSVIAALPQSSSVQIEPLLAFIGEVERQDSDLPEPSSADMAEISTHVEQYISELESVIDSHRERARAILAALPQTEGSVELVSAVTDLLSVMDYGDEDPDFTDDEAVSYQQDKDGNPVDDPMTFGHIRRVRQALALPVDGWRPALLDAAENVYIAWGMGWDLEGVMEVLNKALPPAPDRGGEDG